jgi:DNA-binding transcriptional MerR regulator
MATDSSKKYLAKDVCKRLGLSKKTLYSLESRGLIPSVPRDWRGWRIYDGSHIKAIRRYMASKTAKSE